MIYKKYLKYFVDIIIAIIGILILSPLCIFIVFYSLLSGNTGIFFIHKRPGKYGKPINIIKFKTMNDNKDDKGILLPNSERITKVGSVMRKYSFDEIPQLLNVIKGDLSIVGPRPLEMRYLPLYTKEQNKRHDVRPGLTGWAQINGRNKLNWEEKFELDLWYIENISFYLDIKIILKTFTKVFKSEGVNSNAVNTVIPFDIYLKNKNR